MRSHELLPNLIISPYPTAEFLEQEKFDVIITVCKKPLTDELCSMVPLTIHYPLKDGKTISNDVDFVVNEVLHHLDKGHKTLVHCYLGRNRSWFVGVMAYAKVQGVTPKEALETARSMYSGVIFNSNIEEYICR